MPIFHHIFRNEAKLSKLEAIKLQIIAVAIFAFPIGFLTIRHSVHLSVFIIFLVSITTWLTNSSKDTSHRYSAETIWVALALCSISFATAITQLIKQDFHLAAFDGPSKILLAGLGIFYLRKQKSDFLKILGIAIPLGLIYLVVTIKLHPETTATWSGRYATKFVDPNSLGGQSAILGFLCLALINVKDQILIKALKLIGALCGLIVTIHAQSRGGWITIPIMFIIWVAIQIKQIEAPHNKQLLKKITVTTLLFIGATGLLIATSSSIQNRISVTIFEVSTWLNNPAIYTSAGARLSMWVASIQLISENWLGYGEIAIKEVAINHPIYLGIHQNGVRDLINAGPHSDLLSKGLSLGLLGIAAYLATIFVPFILFFKNISNYSDTAKKAAQIGSIYIAGVFVAGLFNETLSLKYLCSFYGLMITCLAAQVLRDNPSTTQHTRN